jgi:CheY-like chemotaxis protein
VSNRWKWFAMSMTLICLCGAFGIFAVPNSLSGQYATDSELVIAPEFGTATPQVFPLELRMNLSDANKSLKGALVVNAINVPVSISFALIGKRHDPMLRLKTTGWHLPGIPECDTRGHAANGRLYRSARKFTGHLLQFWTAENGLATCNAVRARADGQVKRGMKPMTLSRESGGPTTLENMIDSPSPEFCILVADDDLGIRSFLRRGLRLEGYGVIEADSGEVAVRLTRDAKPDLVVLDWMMPGMDGPEVLRQIRASGATIPVIFFTGRFGGHEERLALGAQDYFEKPVPFAQFVARLHVLLPSTGTRSIHL